MLKSRLVGVDRALRTLLAPLVALLVSLCILRLPELAQGFSPDTSPGLLAAQWWWAELALARWLLLWCLLAAPILWLVEERQRLKGFAFLSGAVLVLQAVLQYYHAVAGTLLGADLFSYTPAELWTTGRAGISLKPWPVLAAAVTALTLLIWLLHTRCYAFMHRLPAGGASLLVGAAFLSQVTGVPSGAGVELPPRMQNKLAFFLDDVSARWSPLQRKAMLQRSAGGIDSGVQDADPHVSAAYPFAHAERTPDTLGPFMRLQEEKPNFIFLIVEGLGRSFSGPGARSGSFTPFLDELASRSLYWENFLATQGRTFAVLPSVFGSLPFAQEGFNALGDKMPRHDSLLSLLKDQGYSLRYYTGSGLEFDSQGAYLQREGVTDFVSEIDFRPPARKWTEWGYADRDLLDLVAAREQEKTDRPFVAIVQTMSMHSPFDFPERAEYEQRVLSRLEALAVPKALHAPYLSQRNIYASILYTDDAIRRFFQRMADRPAWRNTILVITGDHRLPELEMHHRLERYHVPLIVASPLLTGARSIRSVSSHFDIAPSILAMLSKKYRFATPVAVSWMGTGLDTEPRFRNLHDIPLQQTKTGLHDFISADHYLAQDKLYKIGDGLQPEALQDAQVAQRLGTLFSRFKELNSAVSGAQSLTDPASAGQRVAYSDSLRVLTPARRASAGASALDVSGTGVVQEVYVSDTRSHVSPTGQLTVRGVFTNPASRASVTFVPLLVLSDAGGKELAESYGSAMQLAPGQTANVDLAMSYKLQGPAAAGHTISMIVSHPDTGKPVGRGQYRLPLGR